MRIEALDLRDARKAVADSRPAPVKTQRAAAQFDNSVGDMTDGFRRISASYNRDLSPLLQDRMIELAWYLYDRNLMAKRLVNFMVEFPLGEGIHLHSKEASGAVQEVLDAFWNDSINRMDLEMPGYARELSIFGEQIITTYVNPVSGAVRLGYVDPSSVDHIVWGSLSNDGADISIPLQVVLKQINGQPARILNVIRKVEDVDDPAFGYRVGDCFLWSVNKAKKGTRGRSDIFAAADYLDGYDQFLFALQERTDMSARIFEDVTLEGFSETEIAEWLAKPENRKPPRPLSKRAHNEKVKYELVSPQMGATDNATTGRQFKNHILGGMGFPEYFYGDGGETNLATAVQQGTPAFKMLAARQQYIRYQVEDMAAYVLDCAIIAGTLAKSVDRDVDADLPELSTQDLTKLANALQQVTVSLQGAIGEGLITKQTAARVFASMVSQIGTPVDADAELEQLKQNPPEADPYLDQPFPVPAADASDPANPVQQEAAA